MTSHYDVIVHCTKVVCDLDIDENIDFKNSKKHKQLLLSIHSQFITVTDIKQGKHTKITLNSLFLLLEGDLNQCQFYTCICEADQGRSGLLTMHLSRCSLCLRGIEIVFA